MEVMTLNTEDTVIDYDMARQLSESLARVRIQDPMLIAWYDGINNIEHPEVPECQHKPGWLAYAEGHNGVLRIDINNEKFSFIFAAA